jgi:hypothetical protein
MPKRIRRRRAGAKTQVLANYQKLELTTGKIAAKHGISTATVTLWAKKAGLPLRGRGRKPPTEPTPKQREIITLARIFNYDTVGARFGMAKQSIHRIVKRWRNWPQTSKPPLAPGDMVFWHGRRLTVLNADCHDGTLIDDRGKVYRHFTWSVGRIPQKVGFNPRYALPAPAAACPT